MTNTETAILDWLCDNGARINPIIKDMNHARSKLKELEPTVFHEDIDTEFNELVVQKIADLITFDLAIPIELVYNTIENKKLLVESLGNYDS